MPVSILAYHRVLPPEEAIRLGVEKSPYVVSPAQFQNQMTFLARSGIPVITLDAVVQRLMDRRSRNQKSVVITFDDGWFDNFAHALPILVTNGFAATFYVISSMIDRPGYMTWAHLREMQTAGMQIASHTRTHRPLELLDDRQIEEELLGSKLELEGQLGTKVMHLSLPHGSKRRNVSTIATSCGYQSCSTSDLGWVTEGSSFMNLPRIMVRQRHSMERFERICLCDQGTILRERLVQAPKILLKKSIGIERYNALHDSFYKHGTKPSEDTFSIN
jgi:peptidoglycan/xylan/chitin deacetylase (PgdA/CDA1 family)